ncbi:calcium-binding protein [Streptomyces sp. CRN 30]|uniref:calcium-binding protein n=1 Tax=Streptomyces sp. CRN 30 TaxID=3075613 RepID=UPI002A81F3A3|nr:calcium-binding protein [Streptomyces sp. CRN 30]
MRIRATVAAVSGALALSALAVPVAHADDSYGDTRMSNVVVNGGAAVVLGPTAKKTIKVTFTATDNSGIYAAHVALYRGSLDKPSGHLLPDAAQGLAKCTKVTGTKSTCVADFTLQPGFEPENSQAGTWKTYGLAGAVDDDFVEKDNLRTFKILRDTNLTTDATPEPVKKGKTLTVTGKLTRANWDRSVYEGYTGQSVKLQFKKKGSSAYKTLKTVKSGTGGAVKTTVKASVDGTYRYIFSGSANAGSVSAKGDVIDVK